MEERSSDTAQTYGSQGPPADVSNQNAEEPGTPSEGGGEPTQSTDTERERNPAGRPGGAGEESQATGSPENAG